MFLLGNKNIIIFLVQGLNSDPMHINVAYHSISIQFLDKHFTSSTDSLSCCLYIKALVHTLKKINVS